MKNLILLSSLFINVLVVFAQPDPYLLKDFKKVNSPAICVSFSPDGKSILAGYNDGNARIISISDGSYSEAFGGHWKGVKAVEMSSDGKFIFTAGDNTLKGWTPDLKQVYNVKDMTTTIMSADLDTTGKFIVAGEFSKTFKVFDALKGDRIAEFRGHTDVAMTVCFNHDGSKIASASGNGNIRIWDRESQKLLAQLNGQTVDIYSVAFSNDDRFLASGAKDKTINIYDLKENKLIKVLKGHSNQVMDVEFSPDGLFLLSASFDLSIRLWELQTGKCLYTFYDSKEAVMDVEFSPDGKTFASASFDQSIKLWNFSHEIMVDYYYSPQINDEMQNEVFLPKQKGEAKDSYEVRQTKAAEMKKDIYARYYEKYLGDLRAGTLPTL
jgi:WD40 repeat protein